MNRALVGASLVGLVLLGWGSHAEASPERGLQLDATWGFRAGGEGVVSEGRVFVGYGHHFRLREHSSTFLVLGLSAGGGQVYFDDPRGLDGKLTANRTTIAPTARAGFAWGKGRWPATYIYLSAAAVRVTSRTDSVVLAEAGTAHGMHLSLGVAWPGSFKAIVAGMDNDNSDDDGEDFFILLAALLPNTLEITYEELHVDGETVRRGGLGLGYSF